MNREDLQNISLEVTQYILLFSPDWIVFRAKFCLFMEIDRKAGRPDLRDYGLDKYLGTPVLGLGCSLQLCLVCMSWCDLGVYFLPSLYFLFHWNGTRNMVRKRPLGNSYNTQCHSLFASGCIFTSTLNCLLECVGIPELNYLYRGMLMHGMSLCQLIPQFPI